MTETDMRELDAWIAVNVMGWIPVRNDYWDNAHCSGEFNCNPKDASAWAFEYKGGVKVGKKEYCSKETYNWRPTDKASSAIEVLKKCYERSSLSICSCKSPDGFKFWLPNQFTIALNAPTLELAICLFAKKLFTKANHD